jgi:hypothetical protein
MDFGVHKHSDLVTTAGKNFIITKGAIHREHLPEFAHCNSRKALRVCRVIRCMHIRYGDDKVLAEGYSWKQ